MYSETRLIDDLSSFSTALSLVDVCAPRKLVIWCLCSFHWPGGRNRRDNAPLGSLVGRKHSVRGYVNDSKDLAELKSRYRRRCFAGQIDQITNIRMLQPRGKIERSENAARVHPITLGSQRGWPNPAITLTLLSGRGNNSAAECYYC